MSDIYQNIDGLDARTIESVIERLEARAGMPAFEAMRERYLAALDLGGARRVLDLGCGTGASTRALLPHIAPGATLVGTDLSEKLIAEAKRRAGADGDGDRVVFEVADSHALEARTESFDIVIAHTLVSHVRDPSAVLAEAARLTRPGGAVAVFDGDYASITLGFGDQDENADMVRRMLRAIVANPFVMRGLSRMAGAVGLKIREFLPDVLAEAGRAEFFAGMINAYVPVMIHAGTAEEGRAEAWRNRQIEASDKGEMFGSCNFYTYVLGKPA